MAYQNEAGRMELPYYQSINEERENLADPAAPNQEQPLPQPAVLSPQETISAPTPGKI